MQLYNHKQTLESRSQGVWSEGRGGKHIVLPNKYQQWIWQKVTSNYSNPAPCLVKGKVLLNEDSCITNVLCSHLLLLPYCAKWSKLLHGNIDQILVNKSLQNLLNFEIVWLDCHVITTLLQQSIYLVSIEYTYNTYFVMHYPCGLFRSYRSIFVYNRTSLMRTSIARIPR